MENDKADIASLKKGRYQVITRIGTGGFGITYLCVDLKADRLCAVKEYLPGCIVFRDPVTKTVIPRKGWEREYLHGLKRFWEEATLLRCLESLPSMVKILDLFEEHRTAYYVMEYINGKTARELMLEAGGKLAFEKALDITLQSAAILGMVHRQAGILHRDVGPDNIMVLHDGTVRIIDFGNARQLPRQGENPFYTVVLKPGFAPPEQYSGTGRQGSYTDVYALAGTFYFLCSGKRVPSVPARLSGTQVLPLNRQVPECSQRVSDAVDGGLVIDYRKRTQTMEAFAMQLTGITMQKRTAGGQVDYRKKQETGRPGYNGIKRG